LSLKEGIEVGSVPRRKKTNLRAAGSQYDDLRQSPIKPTVHFEEKFALICQSDYSQFSAICEGHSTSVLHKSLATACILLKISNVNAGEGQRTPVLGVGMFLYDVLNHI